MKLIVEIPEEFESDFNEDKFEECFSRILVDLDDFKNCILCGRYEKETFDMIEKAFRNAEPCVPSYVITKTTFAPFEQETEILTKTSSEAESIEFLKNTLLEAMQDPDLDGVLEYSLCNINKDTLCLIDDDVNLLKEVAKDKKMTLHFMSSPSGMITEFYQIIKI